MTKFTVISGTIKKTVGAKKFHTAGDEIELDAAEAALINKKSVVVEASSVHAAKAKAKADAKAAVEKAEKEALESIDAETKKSKGGGK